MDDKQVKITLMFGSDAGKAQADLSKLQQRFGGLEQKAGELRKELDVFRQAGKDSRALERELQDVEKQMLDVASATRKVDDSLQGIGSKELFNLRDIGEKLSQVGGMISNAGRSITAPIMGAVSGYLQNAGADDPIAARWAESQQKIDASYQRIGAVAADQLLPAIEAAADLVENIADLVEQNPELIKIALGAGAGLQVVGSGLQMAGSLAMLKGTGQALLGSGAAGAGALGAAGVLGGSAIAGGLIGKEIADAIQRSLGQEESTWGDIAKTFQQLGAIASPLTGISQGLKAIGFEDQASKVWEFNKALFGLGDAADKNKEKVESAAQKMMPTTDELRAFDAYQQAAEAREAYEKQSDEQRSAIVAQFGQQRVALEQQYEQQRAQLTANYLKAEADALAAYQSQRAQAVDGYNRQQEQAARDHQKQLEQLEQDHNDRVRDLSAVRDAVGLARENAAYDRQKNQLNQDYQAAQAARAADFAAQLAQMDAAHAAQSAQRSRDYAAQLTQLEESRAAQLEQMSAQEEEKLALFDEQAQREKEQLRKNAEEREQILNLVAGQHMSIAEAELKAFQDKTLADYQAWITSLQNQPPPIYQYGGGSYAEGGYVERESIIRAGERGREFILSNRTTQAAERLVGRRLNQQSMLQAMQGRAGQSIQMVFQLGNGASIREMKQIVARNNRELMSAIERQFAL